MGCATPRTINKEPWRSINRRSAAGDHVSIHSLEPARSDTPPHTHTPHPQLTHLGRWTPTEATRPPLSLSFLPDRPVTHLISGTDQRPQDGRIKSQRVDRVWRPAGRPHQVSKGAAGRGRDRFLPRGRATENQNRGGGEGAGGGAGKRAARSGDATVTGADRTRRPQPGQGPEVLKKDQGRRTIADDATGPPGIQKMGALGTVARVRTSYKVACFVFCGRNRGRRTQRRRRDAGVGASLGSTYPTYFLPMRGTQRSG